ncbi:MAG: ribbon-helix-helix protein, CopG family [Thaumarchaeota archaeon]|nr:ribbon-helix-helix protein, CopG family [Nitrososphaerota archaeon]
MSSRTSIQLDRDTKNLLDRVKRERNAKTYSEAIRLLAKEAMKLETSEIGSLPKLRSFKRDKHDRID